jgi:putative aldouronate transport system substrate-binding protein
MRRALLVLTVVVLGLALAGPLMAATVKIPYKGTTVELSTWMMYGGENPQDLADKPTPYTAEWMKKVGNIKWKVYGNAPADYDARFAILAANGPLYDFNVVRSQQEVGTQYGAAGQMLDLMPYVEKGLMPNLKKNWLDKYPSILDVAPTGANGKKQIFAVGAMSDGVEFPECWLYNKTQLDKYGIAVPKTTDEFMAAMKKLKASDPAVVPFIYMWKSFADIAWYSGMSYMFAKYRNTDVRWDVDQKKWVYGPIEPSGHLKEMLQFMNQMYVGGLFNPDQETQDGAAWSKLTQSGKWGFTFTYYSNARVTPANNGMIKAGAADKYEIAGMIPPKGPSGTNVIDWGVRTTGGAGWGNAISAKTKFPDLCVALVDYLYSDEMIAFFNYGPVGITSQKNKDGTYSFLPEWNTSGNPSGYKDIDKYGLGGVMVPYASNYYQAARFNRYYPAETLAMASVNLRGLLNGSITGQWFDFAPPAVTTAEGDQMGKIKGPINTYVEENVVKFIKGQRSFDDWDTFVKDIKNLGIQTYLDILNSKKTVVPTAWSKAEIQAMLLGMGQKP